MNSEQLAEEIVKYYEQLRKRRIPQDLIEELVIQYQNSLTIRNSYTPSETKGA